MIRNKVKPMIMLAIGILFLATLAACDTNPPPTTTPTPSPSPSPSSTPPGGPPSSTGINDQFGITWSNHPVVKRRDADRVQLAEQAGARWDRWSAFWYWVEQPDRAALWGPGNFNFEGDFTYPDSGNVESFNLREAATGNQGHLNTLVVLDGIPRRYDCTYTSDENSGCPAEGVRIQGLFEEPIINGGVNTENHWADYVSHSISFFSQHGIHYYQTYNEPNEGFWIREPAKDKDGDVWINDYVQLISVTLDAAALVDPNAKLVLGASPADINAYQPGTWLDQAFKGIERAGLHNRQNFAGIAIHSYYLPVWTPQMHDRIGSSSGMNLPGLASKPLWITESGVRLSNNDDDNNTPWVSSSSEQAAYIIQQYAYALIEKAERVFHHRLAWDYEVATPQKLWFV